LIHDPKRWYIDIFGLHEYAPRPIQRFHNFFYKSIYVIEVLANHVIEVLANYVIEILENYASLLTIWLYLVTMHRCTTLKSSIMVNTR
jgi:hypothetical protein